MHKMRMAVLVSVLAGLLLAALPASASAGLAGWQYQREITIQENSGETLRDYQMLVDLSGSDFRVDAQQDGDDIRFTDADGRELNYWIEEFDAGSKRAKIWVKVPEIPANGEVGITMWYGNPGAESESDGETVFEFFDDFDGSGLDTSKWTDNSVASVSKSVIIISSSSDALKGIYSNSEFINKAIRFKTKTSSSSKQWEYAGFSDYIADGKVKRYVEIGNDVHSQQLNMHLRTRDASEPYQSTFIGPRDDDWHVWDVLWKSGEGKGRRDNGHYITNRQHMPSTPLHIQFGVWTSTLYVDWILARHYTSPEPTITLAPPAPAIYTTFTITKSPTPHSIRQFQETTITITIDNSGTTDATDIEITDAIHPSFDLISGDFPNPKRYDLIRPGETRDLQYTISAKESGTFTLDPATVTYADEDGNILEAKSEPASIKVIPSTDGSTSGTSHNPSLSTASVQLHGEKTDVVLGEDILFKLSAVNLITKPTMHVQVIIIPPSGMSVTSSAFAKSGAGQYTTTYELKPGTGKDIEVAIRSNQVGDFNVNGRIIYYFGDDIDEAEDHTLNLPIKVRAEPGVEQTESPQDTPGFAALVAAAGVLLVVLLIKRRR